MGDRQWDVNPNFWEVSMSNTQPMILANMKSALVSNRRACCPWGEHIPTHTVSNLTNS